MTFTKAALPSCIEAGGILYEIHTDFRFALILLEKLRGKFELEDADFMYAGEAPPDRAAGFKALAEWLNPRRELPRPARIEGGDIMVDYELDAPLIYAAFFEMYGLDLFDEKLRLHWHKFLALLGGLHGTKLNEVMQYRSYKPRKGEPAEYRREMLRLKEMWRIEERLTEAEQKKLDEFQSKLK